MNVLKQELKRRNNFLIFTLFKIISNVIFIKECFNLTIDETPDIRSRNKSEIIVKSCFAWLCTDESPVSGYTMLQVDIPSGYIMLQPDANKIVRSKVVPQLKDADMEKPGKTLWYFEYITNQMQCFEHTVRR